MKICSRRLSSRLKNYFISQALEAPDKGMGNAVLV